MELALTGVFWSTLELFKHSDFGTRYDRDARDGHHFRIKVGQKRFSKNTSDLSKEFRFHGPYDVVQLLEALTICAINI